MAQFVHMPIPWWLIPTKVFREYQKMMEENLHFKTLPIENQRELVFASMKIINEKERELYWPKNKKKPKKYVKSFGTPIFY